MINFEPLWRRVHPMSLKVYFDNLIKRVDESDEIQNNGKDKDGFFLPTRSVLLQRLHLLRDLHAKPGAKAMVQKAWEFVSEELPPEWLKLTAEEKAELKKILT